jgi:hypothetical protein
MWINQRAEAAIIDVVLLNLCLLTEQLYQLSLLPFQLIRFFRTIEDLVDLCL